MQVHFFFIYILFSHRHVYKFCQRNLFFSEVPKVDLFDFGNKLSKCLFPVPESVKTVTVATYETTSVDVTWTLKTCDCEYDWFELSYSPDDGDGANPIEISYVPDTSTYTSEVASLTEGREYTFTVVSVSGTNRGDMALRYSEEENVLQRTSKLWVCSRNWETFVAFCL